MEVSPIFGIIVLILSVIIHEVAHGYAALAQGDETAKYAGRLTLNPLPHIDILGSIILPGLLLLTGAGIVFGWAKPVPYNPYNLKNQRWGELIVAAAGPLSNILLALIFGLLFRFAPGLGLPEAVMQLSLVIVVINIVLAIFNLIPIYPLDGSKILFALLPYGPKQQVQAFMQRYSLILIVLLLFVLWELFTPIIFWAVRLFTGF